mmetsp:Transcript_112690/g.283325  ORF Transcript_112690/g.283325 Transcript_112690/m.283325 type:complete len:627 (+) Transcript_112690:66-1946(+)
MPSRCPRFLGLLLLTLADLAISVDVAVSDCQHRWQNGAGVQVCLNDLEDELGFMQLDMQMLVRPDRHFQTVPTSQTNLSRQLSNRTLRLGQQLQWQAWNHGLVAVGGEVYEVALDSLLSILNLSSPVAWIEQDRHAVGHHHPGRHGTSAVVVLSDIALVIVLCLGLGAWNAHRIRPSAPGKSPQEIKSAEPVQDMFGVSQLRWYHIAILMQLDIITPMTQDAYIPSLPVMADELHTTLAAVGMSLQVNWIFSGIIALILGITSDHIGRRPVLLGALLCYIIGALWAAVCPKVEGLIIARCIQGIGGGSQMLCYAIARDCVEEEGERTKLFSLFSIVATMAITLAPIFGGVVAVALGWRMIFVLLASWGITIFFSVLIFLPETNPALGNRDVAVANELQESKSSRFSLMLAVFQGSSRPLGLFMSAWLLMPMLMTILSNMPFILDSVWGTQTTGIFIIMSALALCALSGSGLCFLLLRIMTTWQVLKIGMIQLGIVAITFWVIGLTSTELSLRVFLALPSLYIFSQNLIIGPLRSVLSQPFADAAGTANGLAQALTGPLGAIFGFTLTCMFQSMGFHSWLLGLGALAVFHQVSWWSLAGWSPEQDEVFHQPAPTLQQQLQPTKREMR